MLDRLPRQEVSTHVEFPILRRVQFIRNPKIGERRPARNSFAARHNRFLQFYTRVWSKDPCNSTLLRANRREFPATPHPQEEVSGLTASKPHRFAPRLAATVIRGFYPHLRISAKSPDGHRFPAPCGPLRVSLPVSRRDLRPPPRQCSPHSCVPFSEPPPFSPSCTRRAPHICRPLRPRRRYISESAVAMP